MVKCKEGKVRKMENLRVITLLGFIILSTSLNIA
jgi:hypothetical protein